MNKADRGHLMRFPRIDEFIFMKLLDEHCALIPGATAIGFKFVPERNQLLSRRLLLSLSSLRWHIFIRLLDVEGVQEFMKRGSYHF